MSWTVTITEQTAEGTLVGQPVLVTVGEVQLVGGGGSLPDQSGNAGAVLGTDGTDPSWVLRIERGDVYVGVESAGDAAYAAFDDGTDYSQAKVDATGAYIEAVGSSDSASVKATPSGDIDLTHTGTLTINTVPLDVSGGSTGDVLTFDGTGIALDAPSGGGGGGLVLVDSGTFSGSSTPHFNNVFDNSYTVHRVIIQLTTSSADFLRLRLRVGGSDNSSSNYKGGVLGYVDTAADKGLIGVTRTDMSAVVVDFIGAAQAAYTTIIGTAYWGSGGAAGGYSAVGVHHEVTTAYDGFTLFDDSSGTLAGSYWVYGYAT